MVTKIVVPAIMCVILLAFTPGCSVTSSVDGGGGNDVSTGGDAGTDSGPDAGTGDGGGGDAGCTGGCPGAGASECTGATAYRVCETGPGGCLVWSAEKTCAGGAPCTGDKCAVKCTNQQCTSGGAIKCLNNSETVKCADFNADGCLEWGDPASCNEGLVCTGGYCFSKCQDECTTSGAKKCDGNYIVTCLDGGGGCLMWGNPIACGTKDCSNGACRDNCENECTTLDSKLCDGNGYRVCRDYDSDGCLEWGTTLQCPKGQICSNGKCSDKCADECTAVNAKKCVTNSVAVCDDHNSDGCLEWGTPVPCDNGLKCNGGHCELECISDCTVAKARKCDEGGNVVVCDDWLGDGCLKWGTPSPCNPPLKCNTGNCTVQCSDGCDAKNSKQCVIGTSKDYQVCDDWNEDGCLEWGSAQTCSGNLVCDKGNCALSCTNECDTDKSRTCDGNSYKICGEYDGDGCLEWGTLVPCELWQTCDSGTGMCKQKTLPAKVLISEILYYPAAFTHDLFIELHGPADTDLTGFRLVGVKGTDGSDYNSMTLSGKIGSGGYFVVAHPDAAQAIRDKADMLDAKVEWRTGPDSIQLRYGAILSDAVGYGNFAGAVFAGEGTAAQATPAGHSIGRDKNNTDTDNNALDFKDYATPSPGTQNLLPNIAPAAKIVCPVSGNAGQSLQFDASQSSDPDGMISTYEFNWGDGTSKTTGAASKVNHTFTGGGLFTVTLKVTDDGGLFATDTCGITITDPNAPTVVLIKPADNKQVTQGDTVAVLADATPTSGRTISKVELVVDGAVVGSPDVSAPYEFTYQVPMGAVTGSTINVQARATDSAGSSGTSPTAHLKVKNDPPVPGFTAIVTGALKVTFDGSSSYDTETPTADLKVRWDFENDGTWDTSWSTGKVVVDHPYTEGKHTARIEVMDGIGQTASTTRDVTVSTTQTVSGTVTTTTWTGTIIITGDVVVPAGNTLTVASGTSVQFTYIDQNTDGVGDYDITINGTLLVNGTALEPVIFTTYGTDHKNPKAWNRVILSGTGTQISNAAFEYADVALDIRDNSTLTNVSLRNSTNGARVQSPANTVWTGVTVNNNAAEGVYMTGGTVGATGCTIRNNGYDGAYIAGGTFNFKEGTVRDNGKSGIEFYASGGGLLTKNLLTGNALEGLRITTDGSTDPTPVANYNNIFGNAKTAGRVIGAPALSVSTDASYYGTKSSSSWQTPGGEIIDFVHIDYTEYDSSSVSGSVRKNDASGTVMTSAAGATSRWVNVSASSAAKMVALVTDYDSSWYYGSMSVDKAAYMKAGAPIEASVITQSGTIDMRHNYFGVFPDVLSAVSIGRPAAANLQGFVGAAFDSSWTKGPYVGGEALAADATWSGTIYVTGDVIVGSGKKLIVDAGTSVLFANVDQDGNGAGDYGIFVNGGTLNVNGNSADKVTFTQYGATKVKKAWTEVKVYGSGTSAVTYAIFEYGTTGFHAESGSHSLSNLISRQNGGDGFWFKSGATAATAAFLDAEENSGDGVRVEGYQNIAFDHLISYKNGGRGISFQNSTTALSLGHSTITYNTGAGIHLLESQVGIDHNNVNYNGQGIIFEGNSRGNFTYNNVKYNSREGVLLHSAANSPSPVINNNNVYGNSVIEGGRIDSLSLSVSTDASFYGTKTSGTWSTPGGQPILHIYWQYTEYDSSSVSGSVRKDGSSGTVMASTSGATGPKFTDVTYYNASTIVGSVTDYDSSWYYGSTSVTGAFYYDATRPTELTALTDSGKVDCKGNYWGVFPDPTPRFALGRSDSIDFQDFKPTELSGTGP
jgi:hypothetical protein